MKASLYTRDHRTRKYKKHNPKRPHSPAGSVFAPRYDRRY
jgi:hypothetical protein